MHQTARKTVKKNEFSFFKSWAGLCLADRLLGSNGLKWRRQGLCFSLEAVKCERRTGSCQSNVGMTFREKRQLLPGWLPSVCWGSHSAVATWNILDAHRQTTITAVWASLNTHLYLSINSLSDRCIASSLVFHTTNQQLQTKLLWSTNKKLKRFPCNELKRQIQRKSLTEKIRLQACSHALTWLVSTAATPPVNDTQKQQSSESNQIHLMR